jgi:hypothetical protein
VATIAGTAATLAAIVLANDGIRLIDGDAVTEAAIVRAKEGIRLSAAVAVAAAAIVRGNDGTRLMLGVAVAVTVGIVTERSCTIVIKCSPLVLEMLYTWSLPARLPVRCSLVPTSSLVVLPWFMLDIKAVSLDHAYAVFIT